MSETGTDMRGVLRQGQLAVLGILAIALEAAPLELAASARPSPDILLGVVALWTLRRPALAPVLLVFGLGLVRDLLTDLPVGLGALSLVLVAEALRRIASRPQTLGLLRETALVGAAVIAMTAAQSLVLAALFVPRPPLFLLAEQAAFTVLLFPILGLAARWLLGLAPEPGSLRRPA